MASNQNSQDWMVPYHKQDLESLYSIEFQTAGEMEKHAHFKERCPDYSVHGKVLDSIPDRKSYWYKLKPEPSKLLFQTRAKQLDKDAHNWPTVYLKVISFERREVLTGHGETFSNVDKIIGTFACLGHDDLSDEMDKYKDKDLVRVTNLFIESAAIQKSMAEEAAQEPKILRQMSGLCKLYLDQVTFEDSNIPEKPAGCLEKDLVGFAKSVCELNTYDPNAEDPKALIMREIRKLLCVLHDFGGYPIPN